MKKTALITGISGQDGAYLAQFLLKKNYRVIGADRRSARDNKWRLRYLNIENKFEIVNIDLTEITSLIRLFEKYNFDEVYNLAAQSFVGTSFVNPIITAQATAIGALNILEVIRNLRKKPKFYQASSSEMYGDVEKNFQNEFSKFNPQSPYAVSKVFAHQITKNYRNSYNMFAVSGILFNHESPLRGEEFITRKITLGLSKILASKLNCLEVGNIYAKRDWGFAGDYVEAMWKMLQQKKPDDYVIATGKTYDIKHFINTATRYLKMKTKWVGSGLNEKLINLENKKVIIKINKKYFRPAEVNYLKGNYSKAKRKLKWKPKINLKELVKIMLKSDFENYGK
ncbi:GDP-mannose 4,6-dehydratase [Candidatus Pelagibacter sp.]|nr:GDP-mannose 4,6-dehydratase [Candidatus Pelagibacter sp.]